MPNILLTRIDNRLIHGQVGVTWTMTLGANLILVADDEVAENELMQQLMANVLTIIGRKIKNPSSQKSTPTIIAIIARPMPCINVISIKKSLSFRLDFFDTFFDIPGNILNINFYSGIPNCVTWTMTLGANLILVADDEVAENELMQQLMAATAKSSGASVRFFTIQKTIDVIHKAADRQKIFIVCKTPKDVRKLIEGGVPIQEVNVGNMHFFMPLWF